MSHEYLWQSFRRYAWKCFAAGSGNLVMIGWLWECVRVRPHFRTMYVLLATLNAASFVYAVIAGVMIMWRWHKIDRMTA